MFEWIHWLYNSPIMKLEVIIATFLVLLVFTFCVIKIVLLYKQIQRLKMARDGEKIVAEELQVLISQGAAILHDVQGNKFNIDHIVVSDHGVFVVETKTFSKPAKKNSKIYVNGKKILIDGITITRDPVEQSCALSKWVQELLQKSTGKTFSIKPVILFPGWFVEPMKSYQDFWVLNPKALPTFIGNEPKNISDSDVHLITFHLSRYIRTYKPS